MAIGTNNDNMLPYLKERLLSGIWELNFPTLMKVCAWRLVRGNITMMSMLRKQNVNRENENINNMFKTVNFADTSGEKKI